MKASRVQAGGPWRGITRSRAVTLRGVRSLLTRIFLQGEQGTAIDYSDLTEEKLAWRRNLFTETEYRNGPADATSRGGNITATTLPGYAGALLIAPTGGVDCYAYKASVFTAQPNRVYTMSAVIQMTDGLAPNFNSTSASSASIDFTFRMGTSIEAPMFMNSIPLGGGLYRVWMTRNVGASGLSLFGPVKYASTSSRSFKITAIQIELGELTPYQALTDVNSEFLAAFPTHSLYQDSQGQLAVVALEQPIGMALDMRFNGMRGAEAWGASPSVPAGWTNNGGGSYTHAGGSSGSSIGSSFPVSAGKTYEVSFVVAGRTAGTLTPYAGATGTGPVVSANGSYHAIFTAAGGTGAYLFANAAFDGTVSNISFREVVGNHAIQTVANDRPICTARYNRLLSSEDWTSTAWTKAYVSVAGKKLIAGTESAGYKSIQQTPTGWMPVQGATFTVVARIKADGYNFAHITVAGNNGRASFDLTTGATTAYVAGLSLSAVADTDGYWLCRFTGTVATAGDNPCWIGPLNAMMDPSTAWAGDGVKGILVDWVHAERGVSVPRYQRVNTATDYDLVGFPKGARFNGANSWMLLPGLDLSTVGALVAVASLRKENDKTTAMLIEHSGSTASNDGTFGIRAPQGPDANNYGFALRGAGLASGTDASRLTQGVFAGPVTTLVTFVADLSAADLPTQIRPRINGAAPVLNSAGAGTPAGTGNFGNFPAYIGRRAGASLPFSGVIYRLAVRGGGVPDNFVALMEKWANEPIKVLP